MAYTFDKTEDFDVLTITKKQIGLMAFRDVEVGVPDGFKVSTEETRRIERQQLLRHALVQHYHLETAILCAAVGKAVIYGIETRTKGTGTYSHGAGMSEKDSKCAINFFGASHDDTGCASLAKS